MTWLKGSVGRLTAAQVEGTEVEYLAAGQRFLSPPLHRVIC